MADDQRSDAEAAEGMLVHLLGTVLAYVVMGTAILAVVDLLFITASGGEFGNISGWVGAVPAVFAFNDRFKRYRGASRWAVALVGIVLGLGAGIAATVFMPATWPPLVTGAFGGLVAVFGYSVLWHTAIGAFGEERTE
ncbi:hypothetical protein [Glycomyces salinus]|uniref:hypothetical protein n=1 Tax=Glycomyces salinus TaxID=980294 RepID=UPI0018EC18E2|nr:hypothetical protein [Glycomyces salinus]